MTSPASRNLLGLAPPADARTATAMQRLFYEHSRLSLVALALLSILQTTYAAPHRSAPLLCAWLALALGLLGVRWHWRRERLALADDTPEARHPRWQRRAVLGSAAAGLLWAWALVLDFRAGDLPSQMFCAMLICITCVASITVMAPLPAAYWALVWPPTLVMVPLLLLRLGGPAGVFFALLAIGATLMSLALVTRHARLLRESHAMRYEREDLLERLQQADATRRRLLAAASHDLRQPLHGLGLWTAQLQQTLAGVTLPADARTAVAAIAEMVATLDRLVAALMDLGRLDAGGLQVEPRVFALDDLLRRLGEELAPLAEQHGLQWRVRLSAAWVRSDPVQLERMLRNLLVNALRFTEHGGVLLAAQVRGEQLRVGVWDTGPGIPPERQRQVFDEFVQLGNPERDSRRGLGLGLSIVQRLARLLGHAVELRSRPGRGSCFSVLLPLAEPATAAAPAGTVPEDRPLADQPTPRIVLVEDDAAAREATMALLQRWPCEVKAFAGTPALRDWLLREPGWAKAVISDWRLPEEDGLAAIQAVREAAAPARVAALLITGDVLDGADTQRCTGNDIQLAHKPLPASALRAWVLSLTASAAAAAPAAP